MTRKGFKLGAVALAATGALCSGLGTGHAFSGDGINGNVGNTLDPNLVVNNMVGQNGNRTYADIKSVAFQAGPTLSVNLPGVGTTSIPQMETIVTMNGNIPASWPATGGKNADSALDTGIQVSTCFDVPSGELIATTPVKSGTDITGAPIYSGPFPSKFGWKVCSFAAIAAPSAQDSGVATYDVQGTYTFSDQAQLNNGAGVNTYTQAQFGCAGANTVCYYFPYTWWTFDASTGRELGTQFLATGEVARNITVETQINEGVTLPAQECAPVFGCIQGVGGLLTTVDWAPGSENCPQTLGLCTQQDGTDSATGADIGNGLNLGLTGLGYPFGGEPFCTGVDGVNGAPAGSTGCVNETNTASTPPSSSTIVYGRLIPPTVSTPLGPEPLVAGYQPDGATFTA